MAVVSVKSLLNKLIDMKLETLRSDDGRRQRKRVELFSYVNAFFLSNKFA